jgi:hypothetical protein
MSDDRERHGGPTGPRDEPTERRLRAWLDAGPERLPARVLDPVLAHADAHPRRAGRLGLAAHRARVALREALAGPRRPGMALAGIAALVVLVASVGLVGWILRPPAYGPGSPLAGWTPATAVDTCVDVRFPVQIDRTRWVAGRLECSMEATDARQDGVRSVALSTLTIAAEGLGTGFGPIDELYGRGTQRTANGPWQCVFTGQNDDEQRIAASCRGTGTQADLELVIVGTSPHGGDWVYRSWIGPATPGEVPPVAEIAPAVPGVVPTAAELAAPDLVTGTETCTVVDPGAEERAGDAVHVRGERLSCEIASADDRIAGTLELERSSERLDYGGLTTWGTARLVADGATWAGPFVGAWQPQLDPGETIARVWLVREDGGAGEIVLREEGPPTDRVVEAEIRP